MGLYSFEYVTFEAKRPLAVKSSYSSNTVMIAGGDKLICRTIPNKRGEHKNKYAISTHMGRTFCHLTLDEIESINPELASDIKGVNDDQQNQSD